MRAKVNLKSEKTLTDHPALILASMSPRRQEMMSLIGWNFHISPADVDETPLPEETPQAYVRRLAEAKARAATHDAGQESLVIAADTTVAHRGRILGKPEDAKQAKDMLQSLRGHIHQVFTALAVYQSSTNRMETDLAATDVPMRDYSEAEIEAYIATGDPFDKAGSYAIQHPDFNPVEALSGCYANVVGLPLCHLARTLRKFGITLKIDLPSACQKALSYPCTVFHNIID
jgi:septum formation protein